MWFSRFPKSLRIFCVSSIRLPKKPLFFQFERNLTNNPPVKSRSRFPWLQWGFFFACTGAVVYFSRYAIGPGRESMKNIAEGLSQMAIGGEFRLIDQKGMELTLADFRGKWLLIYFGFCRCPDICPEQLERLVEIHERLALYGKDKDFVPIFITVDPERDTPEVVGEYCKEFSPKLVGLTGSREQINMVAKRYHIYHSQGPKDSDGDYIVDHTVVMYLIGPNGEFVDYYGQVKPLNEIVRSIMNRMKARATEK